MDQLKCRVNVRLFLMLFLLMCLLLICYFVVLDDSFKVKRQMTGMLWNQCVVHGADGFRHYLPLSRQGRVKEGDSYLGTRTAGEDMGLPWIYAITPTYARPQQKAELVRLCSTFLHVKHFLWIVVEDSEVKNKLVATFLQECGLNYTHLNNRTRPEIRLHKTDPRTKYPRGVDQRNAAIQWLLDNIQILPQGVVYFADDDNTFSPQLFKEMRDTQKVAVWPVGLVGGLRAMRPIVSSSGNVTKWNVVWAPKRPFPLDTAAFAVNLKLFASHPKARFEPVQGHIESTLLTALGVSWSDLEPKADNCTKVYVWHTRTETPSLVNEGKRKEAERQADLQIEV